MTRRIICGLLTILLLPVVTPQPIAGQTATKVCGWIKTGEYWEGDLSTGELTVTFYYKWYCWNMIQ
jgi:hypothetical protein